MCYSTVDCRRDCLLFRLNLWSSSAALSGDKESRLVFLCIPDSSLAPSSGLRNGLRNSQ